MLYEVITLELLKNAQEAQKARLETTRLKVEIYKELLRHLAVRNNFV